MTTKNEDPGSSPQISSTPSDFTTTTITMSSKTSQRVPPPEKPEAIQTRFKVIAAFWAVIIFLGFPIWWKTTSVYRARLPFQEMVEWADDKVGYDQNTVWFLRQTANEHWECRAVVLYSRWKSKLQRHPCQITKRSISSGPRSTPSTISTSSRRTTCD